MDEYLGLHKDASQLFGNYLKGRLFNKVECRKVYYIKRESARPKSGMQKIFCIVGAVPTDIVILGIGENTHIAFNDPQSADFNDPKMVKIVELDERNRTQQVDPLDKICFNRIEEVPTHAITLTVPALFKANYAYAIVPGEKKADAIYHTLNNEVRANYPSTMSSGNIQCCFISR